ncbi:MAG: hypothetical protein ACRCT6_11450 [Notoacmeibacter sp.]
MARIGARWNFRRMMAERRTWPKGSLDWRWRTSAARKHFWLYRGIPASRLMGIKQMSRWMEAIHDEFTVLGVRLTDPQALQYEAMR